MARKRSGAGKITCSVDGFEAALSTLVEESIDKMDGNVKKAVKKGGKEVVSDIQSSGAWNDITGGYRDGWTETTEGDVLIGYVSTVHNDQKPGLAHLLEKGHGGPAPAPPHPHIAPAYEQGVKVFESELKKALSG